MAEEYLCSNDANPYVVTILFVIVYIWGPSGPEQEGIYTYGRYLFLSRAKG